MLLGIFYLGFLAKILSGLKKVSQISFSNEKKPFVSVIVPFRNESDVILKCLRSLETQKYPTEKYEILFVDDFSEDDSVLKLTSEKQLAETKILSVPNEYQTLSPKKRCIKYGIENAKGEIILTTDADCLHQKNWIAAMVSTFDESTGFVSGLVKFSDAKKLFGKIQQLEFGGLVLTGAGLIGTGSPTICNAANIAFRKDAFDFVGGYDDNQHLSSGDDEFLMQKIAKSDKYKVQFLFSENAVVETEANRSVSGFIQQRKRWASKGLFYNDKMLILKLIFIYFFFLSLPVQLLLGLILHSIFLYSFIIMVLGKVILEYLILKKGIPLLYRFMEFPVFVFAEILHVPYIILAGFAGALGNFEWKGRNLKR
jgi:cellulose synthase/poly-beta-1,6-N-acetylglucosamine synthase-like glycosyltransferase